MTEAMRDELSDALEYVKTLLRTDIARLRAENESLKQSQQLYLNTICNLTDENEMLRTALQASKEQHGIV